MCCLVATLMLLGPRAAILIWWLFDQQRWEAAFSNFFWAFAGWFVAPWTTMMWALVYEGGATGFDWIWLGVAVLADLGSWTSGAWSGKRRYYPATQP